MSGLPCNASYSFYGTMGYNLLKSDCSDPYQKRRQLAINDVFIQSYENDQCMVDNKPPAIVSNICGTCQYSDWLPAYSSMEECERKKNRFYPYTYRCDGSCELCGPSYLSTDSCKNMWYLNNEGGRLFDIPAPVNDLPYEPQNQHRCKVERDAFVGTYAQEGPGGSRDCGASCDDNNDGTVCNPSNLMGYYAPDNWYIVSGPQGGCGYGCINRRRAGFCNLCGCGGQILPVSQQVLPTNRSEYIPYMYNQEGASGYRHLPPSLDDRTLSEMGMLPPAPSTGAYTLCMTEEYPFEAGICGGQWAADPVSRKAVWKPYHMGPLNGFPSRDAAQFMAENFAYPSAPTYLLHL